MAEDFPAANTPHPGRSGPDEIELEPWYRDGNDDIVEPTNVTVQTQYFWKQWVRILGVGPAALLIRLRMYCYDNRKTGERRDWCFPGQKTLGKELGVHRETIMTWLRRLETADFLRRKPRTRWSAQHGRPVRTTNAYRVKMWDPVIPEHDGAAFVRDVERVVNESANPVASQPDRHMSEIPTLGLTPVDNRPHESKKPTHDAVGKSGNRKRYLEEVLNNVNVERFQLGQDKDEAARTQHLVDTLVRELGDPRSRNFFRLIAERLPSQTIYSALSETKATERAGQLRRSPGALFTHLVKVAADRMGVRLAA